MGAGRHSQRAGLTLLGRCCPTIRTHTSWPTTHHTKTTFKNATKMSFWWCVGHFQCHQWTLKVVPKRLFRMVRAHTAHPCVDAHLYVLRWGCVHNSRNHHIKTIHSPSRRSRWHMHACATPHVACARACDRISSHRREEQRIPQKKARSAWKVLGREDGLCA